MALRVNFKSTSEHARLRLVKNALEHFKNRWIWFESPGLAIKMAEGVSKRHIVEATPSDSLWARGAWQRLGRRVHRD